MKLTPVKVRGKGPRKSGFKPPNPKRLKLTTDQTGPGTSLFKQSSAAPIEKLPVEILQKILILSGEHNFPRASLRIGMLLSHPSFIAEMVLKAFEPTWDLWLGCAKSQVHSYTGWYQDTERFGGDPELQVSQSGHLRCPQTWQYTFANSSLPTRARLSACLS